MIEKPDGAETVRRWHSHRSKGIGVGSPLPEFFSYYRSPTALRILISARQASGLSDGIASSEEQPSRSTLSTILRMAALISISCSLCEYPISAKQPPAIFSDCANRSIHMPKRIRRSGERLKLARAILGSNAKANEVAAPKEKWLYSAF